MPGWYIHMESAKRTIDGLRAGDTPDTFPGGVSNAQELGEIAHKWRNYLAAGAIGPDIFFLLPDFTSPTGNVILTVVKWIRDVWEWFDEHFMSAWEKWVRPGVVNQITGGLLNEIGQFMQELSSTITDLILDLVAKLWDWFGLLTSGVPQGYADSNFYWSDMFHYRKTYQFAKQLFKNAASDQDKSEQFRAFALGWISHCATDVTGHSFVNEKCGGPWRLHWQRHHLVENHMDASVYDSLHGGVEPYGELDTSCLHFRVAFRKRNDQPYDGAEDAPAYDYFGGASGPPYAQGESDNDIFLRKRFFDLDTGELPEELCNLIIKTMGDVYNDHEPKIMSDFDQEFHDGTSGRPSVEAIQQTFYLLYHFLKFTTTGGYSPPRPTPPDLIGDHSPPLTPGTDGGISDDTSRGQDPDSDDDSDWSFWDLLVALFGWAKYIFDFGVWLATLPIAIINDIVTFPVREVVYEYLAVPMWSVYLAARRPLVMMGFLMPKHEEVSRGLVELGISPTGPLEDLAAALASPDGTGTASIAFDEHSGRDPHNPNNPYGTDRAYPRAIIKDDLNTLANILHYVKPDVFCGQQKQPSEFLRPWKYPDRNNANLRNGWEPALTHPGPFFQGQDARALMNNSPGDQSARSDFERARDPKETESFCDMHLPSGRHLGDPVDYGVYLTGRLIDDQVKLPDFNLDSDRGYGYHCWDWNRKDAPIWDPITGQQAPTQPDADEKYYFKEPCTVPESFCQGFGTQYNPIYNPNLYLEIHYILYGNNGVDNADPGCGQGPGPHGKVTGQDEEQAGMPPEGGGED
jgi:zinc dependent phospholipase C